MRLTIGERIEASIQQVSAVIDLIHLKEGDDDLTDKVDGLLTNLIDVLEGIRRDI